ncbi:unnamed protein product [Calicophoron daubneyi]|uniref:Rab11 family-interacting protein 4A n=1 Tax=Calicophoron daubneyi TaxID=300641 RepID=A0AAV2TJL3_CALDB
MSATTQPSLEAVFRALDTEDKGYITVDQFTATFKDFLESSAPKERKISTTDVDFNKLVESLDPEHDGIIHLEDFMKADVFNQVQEPADGFATSLGPGTMGSPADSTNKSNCFSDKYESKTDDSGVHTSMLDGDEESTLSADGLHRYLGSHENHVAPGVTRRRNSPSGPNLSDGPRLRGSLQQLSRGNPYMEGHGVESPGSARSDILMDDVETNFEIIRDQMRRMEARVEDFNSIRKGDNESRIDRLREENVRLTAQVTILEERIKEAEARSQRSVESERQHLQSIMARTNQEHATEVEGLRDRISTLESECSELRVEATRVKADSQTAIANAKRSEEALAEAQDQISALQEQLESLDEKHSHELNVLKKDRDHAVHVLEELNSSMGERRRSRVTSASGAVAGSEVIARYQESQEIVRRLITENKTLRQQLEDAQEELFARSLEEGRGLLKPTEKSWASEIDNCTKEEVVELLTKERYANNQLRQYIDGLITRIIERHPSLLEIATSTPQKA